MGVATLTGRKKYTNGSISKFFIPGNEPEGWILGCTKEYSDKKRIGTQNKWAEEEYRRKQTNTRSTTAYKNKIININKKAWANEDKKKERCEKLSLAANNRWDEEEREKASIRMINKWSEECYRETQTIAIKKGHEYIYINHPEYKEKIAEGNIKAWVNDKFNILLKQAYSKSLNNTWNTSNLEENLYIELLEKYSKDDIERQYNKDPRYPFRCDFYIKPEDLFIELQGTWMHGKHPFDPNNIEDLNILKEWEQKALEHPQYKSAIEIWTRRDVLKKEYAIKNNLNIKFIY